MIRTVLQFGRLEPRRDFFAMGKTVFFAHAIMCDSLFSRNNFFSVLLGQVLGRVPCGSFLLLIFFTRGAVL
jgi:hypothetical protein